MNSGGESRLGMRADLRKRRVKGVGIADSS